MKSKAPLVMMEQMVMILVFALAAALCMQAFVLSDSLSEKDEARDIAVLLCENAAEAAKAAGGEVQGQELYFDSRGNPSGDSQAAYRRTVTPLPEDRPYLGRARVSVSSMDGTELYSLEFAWQIP